MNFDAIYELKPYELDSVDKNHILTDYLKDLTVFHCKGCEAYKRIIDIFWNEIAGANSIEKIPFIPVRIFKEMELCSVSKEEVIKTMYSSGTTGNRPSKIFLDRETAANQQKVMIRILSDFIGKDRLPMLIVDSKSVLRDRNQLAVRGAAILGFSMAGTERFYALDDNMNVDVNGIRDFIKRHENEKILIFGFTFMIWQYLYKHLSDGELDLHNSVLIHGGGWKKLIEEEIDNDAYKDCLKKRFGISSVHNYYGMVEQTGCIYMECECGHLHASVFSDVIIRRASDFSEADIGEEGLIQVVSILPRSYPGHSILTEDRGVILGIDDCPCHRKGKYFKILGRIKKAEVRGCSDAY